MDDAIESLTPRQRQVLDLLASGYSNSDIVKVLGIGMRSVSFHIRALCNRLGVRNTYGATAKLAAYHARHGMTHTYLPRLEGDAAVPAFRHERTTLYRYFDLQGRLLYVGITMNPSQRQSSHSGKQWWMSVVSATFEHFPTRTQAEAAERTAIETENPVHNLEWTPRRRPRGVPLEAQRATGFSN